MPQRHCQPYSSEFRERIVELVRAGRSPEDLSAEFEPSAQTTRNWSRRPTATRVAAAMA